jgi:hypothetical protein
MNCSLCKLPVNFVHDGVALPDGKVNHTLCTNVEAALKEADEIAACINALGIGIMRNLATRYWDAVEKLPWRQRGKG